MATYIEIARPSYQPVQIMNPHDLSGASLWATLSVPFQGVASEPYLYIDFPTFDCRLAASIVDIEQQLQSGVVSIELTLYDGVALELILSGELLDDGTSFLYNR